MKRLKMRVAGAACAALWSGTAAAEISITQENFAQHRELQNGETYRFVEKERGLRA